MLNYEAICKDTVPTIVTPKETGRKDPSNFILDFKIDHSEPTVDDKQNELDSSTNRKMASRPRSPSSLSCTDSHATFTRSEGHLKVTFTNTEGAPISIRAEVEVHESITCPENAFAIFYRDAVHNQPLCSISLRHTTVDPLDDYRFRVFTQEGEGNSILLEADSAEEAMRWITLFDSGSRSPRGSMGLRAPQSPKIDRRNSLEPVEEERNGE